MAISAPEIEYYKKLGRMKVVFDVGCKKDNPFEADEVHQFDPVDYSSSTKGIFNCMAVSDYVGIAKYYPEYESIKKRKDLTSIKWSWVTHKKYMVRVTTIDFYCKLNKIKFIDFLKIDTEGNDLNVVKGAKKMLKNIRYIQFEDWPGIELQEYKEILKGWEFEKLESSPVNYIAKNGDRI